MRVFEFERLSECDLIVDALYEGRATRHGALDPISRILPCGTQGGFRVKGVGPKKDFVVLYTTGEHRDWPDSVDPLTGLFTYYGDNRSPGKELHDTKPGGNRLLRNVFNWLHSAPDDRLNIPPFFVFSKYQKAGGGWFVQFKGIAVPGYPGFSSGDDLVAIWKTADDQRFQNYRASFTILDIPVVSREWLTDIVAGNPDALIAPGAWQRWSRKGVYIPLTATPTSSIRSRQEQSPRNRIEMQILETVYKHFKDAPTLFENFAAKVFQLTDSRVIVDEVTRASVDGGRDVIGRYRLGLESDPIYAEYSLEAKCYRPDSTGQKANSVGVKALSRLISRLRFRQFGVLVTTSFVARQAYSEIRDDRHPIVVICGRDIAEILISRGYSSTDVVKRWLNNEFATSRTEI